MYRSSNITPKIIYNIYIYIYIYLYFIFYYIFIYIVLSPQRGSEKQLGKIASMAVYFECLYVTL